MLLLYGIWALIISAELALLTPLDNRLQEFLCINQACYSISWNSRRYAKARADCEKNEQHLMTVKSSEQADVISLLISKVETENIRVWIGLEPKMGCTDLSLPLRGFTWVTGDTYTDSILWNDDDQKCTASGKLCVTVNKNGTWEETDCTFKSDGLLCESSHSASCSPLILPENYNATYFHPSHGIGLHSAFYPPGTNLNIPSIPDNLLCQDNGDGQVKWIRKTSGAWPCVIGNGGCDHECMVVNGKPECRCPPGLKLKQDERSCSLPCDTGLCTQDCDPTIQPPSSPCRCFDGFYLAEDGKTCIEDDCAAHPNTCGYHCTNSNGIDTCNCKPGFENVFNCESAGECGVKCQYIDKCETATCEHKCEQFHDSFKCVCNEGFVIDKNNPQKCIMACNTAECEADCSEEKCNCPEGYILDETKCVDVDECLENPCEWNCSNLFGSYECTCPEGYILHNDACVPGGTEEPEAVPTETTITDPFPQITFSMEPAVLLGICIGIMSMLTVLIAMACHKLRKHYMDQHDFDYKIKNNEKYVVLQQVKTIPEWRL